MFAPLSYTPERSSGRFTDKGGFTLIEVLVAFTVMATLLSVLYRGVVVMRSGSIAFDDHTVQAILAHKVLDEALAKRDLATGTYSGIREGHRWTIVAKPIDLSGQLPKPDPHNSDEQTSTPGQGSGARVNSPASAAQKDKPEWRPQRLIARIETKGKPLEIETIRLVKIEAGR